MDRSSYFGRYGGAFVPDLLVEPLEKLNQARQKICSTAAFKKELLYLLQQFAGRPTQLTEVSNFSKAIEGPRIFLKREDLLHTGAHKINNTLGQCLLAKKMGKSKVIAETGAGQHGLATATTCARLGLQCRIYMGAKDMLRQHVNVEKMRLLGAEVRSVKAGSETLKEAVNEAFRDWATSYEDTFYCLGSALGPHPYPQMVYDFHKIIGNEAKKQLLKRVGHLPTAVIACVGGGSNALGIFSAFLEDKKVKLIGVEAKGTGALHAARFMGGSPGILHGSFSYLLQDKNGQIKPTHSISAGLDYPSVSPILAYHHDQKRIHFDAAPDREVLKAFRLLSQTEGIIPALESSHALAYVIKNAKDYKKKDVLLINLSGRGDKDLSTVLEESV